MGPLLKIVGALWALVGVANLVMMFARSTLPGNEAFGVIFNVALFILPGLAIAGLGTMIVNRKTPQ